MRKLFEQDLKVVNVGLQGFATNITAAGGQVTNVGTARGGRRGAGLDVGHPRR